MTMTKQQHKKQCNDTAGASLITKADKVNR